MLLYYIGLAGFPIGFILLIVLSIANVPLDKMMAMIVYTLSSAIFIAAGAIIKAIHGEY